MVIDNRLQDRCRSPYERGRNVPQLVTPLDPTLDNVLPDSADVVVIGGGVMGMSAAWHLASRGVRNITVVEQAALGSGSSAKPLGGIRANFSDPNNVILGKRSLDAYNEFKGKFGVDIRLAKVGYLFVARNEVELHQLEANTKVQTELGIDARMVAPDKVNDINPLIETRVLTGASYTPDDGHADPSKVVEGYARACARLGVAILDRTQVLDIDRCGNAIQAVVTNRGKIRTSVVVCAAGAWSGVVAKMADLDLPVEPVRRMIGLTRQQGVAYPTVPFTIDLATTMYFHNYGNGLLVGISHAEESSFCREFSYSWLQEFNASASIWAPFLENPDLVGGWAGFYENTPDHNALIGQSSSVDGFFYITGFSGHGFLQAPAAGELLADIYFDSPSFIDKSAFALERFDQVEGSLCEANII